MNIEDLYPLVRQHVKGCPTGTLKAALRRAARQLCFESRYATTNIVLDVEKGVKQYALTMPNDAEEPVGVRAVQHDKTTLSPPDPLSMDDDSKGTPRCFYFRPPKYVVLLPVPDAAVAAVLRVMVVVQPSRAAETIPDSVGQHFDRGIAAGALAWLFAMPGEQWTDKASAKWHHDLFTTAIGEAKRKAQRAHRPRDVAWRPRRFAI